VDKLTDCEKQLLGTMLEREEKRCHSKLNVYGCNDEATVGCSDTLDVIENIKDKLELKGCD